MDEQSFPLFKGVTRPALTWGIPMGELLLVSVGLVSVAMIFQNFYIAGLIIPVALTMKVITKFDDRAFRQWGLWVETKLKATCKDFWQGVSFSPSDYRQARKRK